MKLLIAEDVPELGKELVSSLEEDYVVDLATDGEQAQEFLSYSTYDAVVLDLGLPMIDGLTVLRNLREGVGSNKDVPVLILSARSSASDRVDAIDRGADDYVTKPYHMDEVLARIRALIRRRGGHSMPRLTWGEITLDLKSKRVTDNGKLVPLTEKEYQVFEKLMLHSDGIVSREELVQAIYDDDATSEGRGGDSINVFINRLRKKLPANIIEVVKNVGYRLSPDKTNEQKD
jgi:two-component system OmpR family response regulator